MFQTLWRQETVKHARKTVESHKFNSTVRMPDKGHTLACLEQRNADGERGST